MASIIPTCMDRLRIVGCQDLTFGVAYLSASPSPSIDLADRSCYIRRLRCSIYGRWTSRRERGRHLRHFRARGCPRLSGPSRAPHRGLLQADHRGELLLEYHTLHLLTLTLIPPLFHSCSTPTSPRLRTFLVAPPAASSRFGRCSSTLKISMELLQVQQRSGGLI